MMKTVTVLIAALAFQSVTLADSPMMREIVGYSEGKIETIHDFSLGEDTLICDGREIPLFNLRLRETEDPVEKEISVSIKKYYSAPLLNVTPVGKKPGSRSNGYFNSFEIKATDNMENVVLFIPIPDSAESCSVVIIPALKAKKKKKFNFRTLQKTNSENILVFYQGKEIYSNCRSDLSPKVKSWIMDLSGNRNVQLYRSVIPSYKGGEKQAGKVRVKVARSGKISSAELISSTSEEYGEACMAAIQHWLFFPKMKEWVPIESTVVLPFRFNSKEGK